MSTNNSKSTSNRDTRADVQYKTSGSEKGRMSNRLSHFGWDVLGVGLLAFGLITLIALFLPQLSAGVLVSLWRSLLSHAFGVGAFIVPLAAAIVGIMVLRQHATPDAEQKVPWGRI